MGRQRHELQLALPARPFARHFEAPRRKPVGDAWACSCKAGELIDVRKPTYSVALFVRMTAFPAAAEDPACSAAVARQMNLWSA